MTDTSERLNKYLALQMGISRREADELIQDGVVAINGTVATLGARVQKDDSVTVNDDSVSGQGTVAYRYVLLNKPIGYVCSRRAQGENPTIYELLPPDMHALKPVGRLDKDSSGVLLLTNDGDFAHTMTHPSFRKVKVYQATLDHALEPLHQQMISDYGVEIGDGVSKLSLERQSDDRKQWTVTMSEGRNRQIRRTFASLGYETTSLHRTDFGQFSSSDINPGEFKQVEVL